MKKLLLSFLLVMVIASGFAQWSINPKANRAVVGSGNTMRSNSSVSDGAGGLVIVFEESVWDGINMVGFTQIFAQRVSSGGVAQWAAPVLIATCPDYTDKRVVSDGAGGVVVLWVQKLTQGNNQPEKIYAQRLNQNGAKQWGATGKELTAMFSSYYISEMLFDNNSFVYSFAQYGAGDGDVFIQKLDMNGNVQWGTGTKINEGVGEYDGRIFKDGAGYLVALVEEYEFNNGNDEGTRLYLQKVNADGTKNGSNVFIDDLVPINGIEYYPEEVIYDGNGGLYYTTSAADDNDDTNVKLYLQHITSTGVKQFTSTLWGLEVDANAGAVIDGGGYSYWTYSASMASDGAGGVVIGWIDTRNANAGVYAQRYNSAGAKLWGATDLLLSPGVVDYFDQQSIQFDANGDLVFRLQKSLGYAKQYLYVQKTSLSGTLLYPTARTADHLFL
ncbi:MAG: hypothetical protein EOO07_10605 [Chitinophagaceae bacterium]|nr:MAG: hypothetical protein EOO07_10605 [Chitinophagaceae bacterium]